MQVLGRLGECALAVAALLVLVGCSQPDPARPTVRNGEILSPLPTAVVTLPAPTPPTVASLDTVATTVPPVPAVDPALLLDPSGNPIDTGVTFTIATVPPPPAPPPVPVPLPPAPEPPPVAQPKPPPPPPEPPTTDCQRNKRGKCKPPKRGG